jgi:hypothetical protein
VFCGGKRIKRQPVSRNKLLLRGRKAIITIPNIPATKTCLEAVEFRLGSDYVRRPIKWAQGIGFVRVTIPLPPLPKTKTKIKEQQKLSKETEVRDEL